MEYLPFSGTASIYGDSNKWLDIDLTGCTDYSQTNQRSLPNYDFMFSWYSGIWDPRDAYFAWTMEPGHIGWEAYRNTDDLLFIFGYTPEKWTCWTQSHGGLVQMKIIFLCSKLCDFYKGLPVYQLYPRGLPTPIRKCLSWNPSYPFVRRFIGGYQSTSYPPDAPRLARSSWFFWWSEGRGARWKPTHKSMKNTLVGGSSQLVSGW